jgi:ribonuclease E
MEQPPHHEPNELQRDIPSPRPEAHAAETVAAGESQPQRRRSTIREAAPGFTPSGEPSQSTPQEAPPAPPPSDQASGEAQPRRFGWWSRKS